MHVKCSFYLKGTRSRECLSQSVSLRHMGDFKPFVNLCQVTFWILANFPGLAVYFLVAGVWSLSCVWLFQVHPVDCSTPGSSVHGISQARVLEWFPLLSPLFILLMSNSHTIKFTHCACTIQWVLVNVERCTATPANLLQHNIVFIILFLWSPPQIIKGDCKVWTKLHSHSWE